MGIKPSEDDRDEIKSRIDQILINLHRFEYAVVIVLAFTVAIITIFALLRLLVQTYKSIFVNWDISDYQAIPVLFGMIMTVVIAMELGNSILRHIKEHSVIIQAREVILIGIMAVVRKVMILDLSVVSYQYLASLGILAVCLAAALWLMNHSE
jgi:uncharacterized membrane protein (DUF373 family)